MTDSTLNPLNFLLPNGPDNRFLFRLFETVGLVSAALIPAFIVYTQLAGRFPSEVQYGTVLYLGLVAVFCLRPALKDADGRRTMLDLALNLVLIAGASFAFAYFTDQYDDIADMREGLPTQWDLACYLVGSVVVVFGAHRAEGWLLTGVVMLAIVYLVFGHVMPGILEHRPFSMNRVLEISYGYRGIFGVALGAVVDIVLVFVILGVTLRLTGAGEFFNDLALILTKGKRSGPAQCAIIASAMFGSINGSAPANVASTGILTIPMMRRAGYSGRFAGGVEATASCVGQIMPPVMGVGAFIMSDVTGIPYITIMFAAIIPAMLYLFSLSITVSLEASRLNLDPLADETPKWDRKMISRASLLIIGFGSLLTMLFSGFPATFSGLVASVIILVLATILPDTRLNYQNWFTLVVDSGRDGLSVLLSCAAIGIVIAAITSTGLGIKLNQEITALGDQNLLAALILAALCSIVLGLGLPTAASYLMVIFVAGPAIMELGVSKLSTHLFVFYYAVLSAITPPVALAIFAAAAIAKENPIRLALNALRLASVGFVLPIAWVYHPEIVIGADGTGLLDVLTYVPLLLVAIVGLSAAHVGHLFRSLTMAERLGLAACAVAVLYPGILINLAATAIILLVATNAFRGRKMSKPLECIRVLDLTNVLAGPFCCHHLAHMGAEVIKVEAAGRGDLARQLGADPELNKAGMGVSFLAQNAGKKSVTVNLKNTRGREIFLKLVETADVVVENFRPGVMTRLGVGYETLKSINQTLIYCAISGFGQDGPWVHRPAYDQIIQGASGVMSITGADDSAPLRVGYPVADTVGGITAAFAISAALNACPRGSFIDVSMLESVLATMGWAVSNYLIAGVEPSANGNENPTSAPSGAFEAARGLINIAANKDEQWVLLTDHLGVPELRDHPEYATREDRKRNRLALKAELETVLRTRPARDWAEELNRIGVPSGAVLTVPEILDMPQVAERGFLNSYKSVPGIGRDIQVVTTGIKMNGHAPSVATPPPILGQHNTEIWAELGLSTEEIEELKKEHVI